MDTEDRKYFEDYAESMQSWMDKEKNPCENFKGYTRGNMPKYSRDFGIYVELDGIIHNGELTYPLLSKVRRFHDSYPDNVGDLINNPGLRQISGGWAALDDNWTGENFDWIRLVGILAAMGNETIFKTELKYSTTGRIVTICALGSYDLSDCFSDYFSSYGGLIKVALKQLRIIDNRLLEIANDLNLIAEKIKEIHSDNFTPQITRRLSPEQIRARPEWNYQLFYEGFTGEQISDDDIFYICDTEDGFLERFLTMLGELQPRTLSNYILLLVAKKFYSYSYVTRTYMAPILLSVGFEAYFSKKDEQKYLGAYQRLVSLTEKAPDVVDPDCIDSIKNTYRLMQGAIELKNTYFTLEKVEKEYENLEIVDDFFQNILNIQRLGVPKSLRRYYFTQPDGGNEHRDEERDQLLFENLPEIGSLHNKPFLFYYCIHINENWYDNFAINTENEKYKLFLKHFQDLITDEDIIQNESYYSFVTEDAAKKLLILKLLFADYKDWLEENEAIAKGQEEILNNVGLTNLQAFFICCEQVTIPMSGFHGDNLKNRICYSHMEEFLAEFKCEAKYCEENCIIAK